MVGDQSLLQGGYMRPFSLTVLSLLVCSIPVSHAGTWGCGFIGGFPYQYSKNAVSSNTVVFEDTEFDNISPLYGGRIFYMFDDPEWAGVDLSVCSHSMDVLADNESLGRLNLMPILAGFTFRGMPRRSGLATHGGLTFGISLNSFDKTAYLDSLEAENTSLDVSVKTSFAMTFKFGVDYFVTRVFAVGADGIWAVNEVPTDGWAGVEHLFIGGTTLQFLFGGTVWIR